MTTNEMIRADELLAEIQQTSPTLETLSVGVQSNPYVGIAAAPFPPEACEILMQEVAAGDVEIRPDGLIYLPEIKYRRILNRAFGPGTWAVLPMEITVSPQDNMLYYKGILFVYGRFVSEAIGEQQYFPDNDRMSYATAAESAKSNCLMRCCKDLGIASSLWDPQYIRQWIAQHAVEAWCVNIGNHDRGKKKKMWRKRSAPPIDMYPWREEGPAQAGDRLPVEQPAFRPIPESTPPWEGDKPAEPARTTTIDRRPSRASRTELKPISIKQAGRFRAIAKANDWTPEEVAELLRRHDYQTIEGIDWRDYEDICTTLQDPVALSEIRATLDVDGINQTREVDDLASKLPF